MTAGARALRKLCPAVIACLALELGASAAHAQIPPPAAGKRSVEDALAVGSSQCLDRAVLAQHIQMWLGGSGVDERLVIQVDDAPEGVRFTVTRDGARVGERTLDVRGVPCQSIHAAVGLGVATAIDATVLTSLGVSPSPPPAPPPAPVYVPVPTPAPPPPPPPPPPWASPADTGRRADDGPRLTVTAQGIVLVGLLPKVQLGVTPSFDLTLFRGFDLRASALATGTSTVEVGAGLADVSLLAGRLEACAAVILGRDVARVRGCGGVLAGAVQAEGLSFPDPRADTGPWVGPTARIDGRWSFNEVFGMLVAVDGFFPGLKPELQVVGPSGAVTAARAFPLAGVGLSMGPSVTF